MNPLRTGGDRQIPLWTPYRTPQMAIELVERRRGRVNAAGEQPRRRYYERLSDWSESGAVKVSPDRKL